MRLDFNCKCHIVLHNGNTRDSFRLCKKHQEKFRKENKLFEFEPIGYEIHRGLEFRAIDKGDKK